MFKAVSGAIVGMQFQDRISQNIVIAQKVIHSIVEYLENSIDSTISEVKNHSGINLGQNSGILDKDFAEKLIVFLTLGELQKQFVDHLITRGYIKNASQIDMAGYNQKVQKADDNVELF